MTNNIKMIIICRSTPIEPVVNYVTSWLNIPILAYMISLLIILTMVVAMLPRCYERTYIRWVALKATFISFCLTLSMWNYFNYSAGGYQFFFEIPLIPEYDLVLSFGLDGISMCFLLLTTFIFLICILTFHNTGYVNYKQFVVYILLVEIFLVLSFCVTNLFFFFVFFESVLIPMYIIIGVWGGRNRKINAAFYFFLYTLMGSFFLLYGILFVYSRVESFNYTIISQYPFDPSEQLLLFVFFFIPFAIKIPMFPYHLWLPEAHVEAPTIGSVILASLLLKLGGYGLLRFTLPMLPDACIHFQSTVHILALMGVIYASFSAARQSDLKRIIAYSSIAHMNLVIIGIFSLTTEGIDGAMYLMMGHGIVSGALFLCVGDLYDRYHTRTLKYFSGLALVMPQFSAVFLVFTLANMSFPGTSNFVGEFLVLSGAIRDNPWTSVFAATGIILSAIYSIWLYNRVSFGTLKNEENVQKYADLNGTDFIIFFILIISMFSLGLYTECITKLTAIPVLEIISHYW